MSAQCWARPLSLRPYLHRPAPLPPATAARSWNEQDLQLLPFDVDGDYAEWEVELAPVQAPAADGSMLGRLVTISVSAGVPAVPALHDVVCSVPAVVCCHPPHAVAVFTPLTRINPVSPRTSVSQSVGRWPHCDSAFLAADPRRTKAARLAPHHGGKHHEQDTLWTVERVPGNDTEYLLASKVGGAGWCWLGQPAGRCWMRDALLRLN